MNPVDRYKAIINKHEFDRYPIEIFDNIVAAKLIKKTYAQSEANAENIANKLIASYQLFGHDAVSLIYSAKAISQEYGAILTQSSNNPASIQQFPLKALNEVYILDDTEFNLISSPSFKKYFQACQLINETIGSQTFIRVHVRAPFSMAGSFIEPENLLRGLRKFPDQVHLLIQFSESLLIKIIDAFKELPNLYFSLSDPLASGDLISPRQYQNFAYPSCQRIISYIHKMSKRAYLHICGNTTDRLDLILNTGADAFSIDQIMNIAHVATVFNKQMILLGNIDPINILLHGCQEDVERAVREIYQQTAQLDDKFNLAPGCDVPYDTPINNLLRYMDIASKLATV